MLVAEQVQAGRAPQALAVRGVSLALAPGELLGVLGANGAGKTTLLSVLAGDLAPAAGEARLDGRALARWPARALARRRAVMPQSAALAFDLPVREVVAMGAYPFPELGAAAVEALVDEALRLAGAEGLDGRRYARLSGGEQQRVQFARVLAQLRAARAPGEYRALLLDEPTASLDPRHQIALLRTVRTLAAREAVAALAVLHDVNLAAAWCDRLLLMAEGRPVALGTPAAVLTPAHLARVYGLAARVLPHPVRAGRRLVVFEEDEAGAGLAADADEHLG